MKQILLLEAPAALLTVSLPSETVTVAVLSIQRFALVGVPLSASTASTLILKTLSKNPASPDTILTLYVPFGTAISHRASGFAGFWR